MVPYEQHVCIRRPCAFCEATGQASPPGNPSSHRVLSFQARAALTPEDERLLEKLRGLSLSQLALVEAFVDLCLG